MLASKCVKPKRVVWESPTQMSLDLDDGNGLMTYKLLKGAEQFIHKKLKLRTATSKDVYKKSPDLWNDLRDDLLGQLSSDMSENAITFSLTAEGLVYIVNNIKEIIDIVELSDAVAAEEFIDKHQQYIIDLTTAENNKKMFTDGRNGLLRLVLWDKSIDVVTAEYTPVILLDLNHQKSEYRVYSGIFMYNSFMFIPYMNCDIDAKSLGEFVKDYNLLMLFQNANTRSEELYASYKMFKTHDVEISVREFSNILRRVGYKLELDTEDKLSPITNINDDENNLKIQTFFNTFQDVTGEKACDILKLSEFKKTFRYNKITLLDVLGILSKEYLTYDGAKITADILASIVYKLYDSTGVDKVQVEDIKKEQIIVKK